MSEGGGREQRDRSEKSLIKTPLKYGRRVRIKVLVFLARVCALSGTAVYVMFCGTRGAGRWWGRGAGGSLRRAAKNCGVVHRIEKGSFPSRSESFLRGGRGWRSTWTGRAAVSVLAPPTHRPRQNARSDASKPRC